MKEMKKIVIIIMLACTFFMTNANAQFFADPVSNDTVHFPYWIKMMQDPDANFSSTQSAFEKYWAGRNDYKGNGWKVFKRWEYIRQFRVGKYGKLPKPGDVLREYERYLNLDQSLSVNGNWIQLGPVSLPSNFTYQPNGMGRINAVAFHPSNVNIIYAGSPSGGLWKTTNGGATWSVLTTSTPTLGVSSILIHPTSTNIILIGTGDRDASDAPGLGVYKSADGGVTWNPSNTGITASTVGMMIMHPSDPDIILAATSTGIFKSTDGGSSWVRKSSNTSNYKDIKFNPGDPTIVYAATGGQFYRSTDTGETWTQITSGIITGNRVVIGVSANQTGYVYLLQTNGPFAGLLRSTDSGLTFSTQSTTPNIMGYECDGSGTASQAWYDLCINVDPNNADIIYAGGINIWKSIDGGVNWTINSHWVGSSWGYSCAPSVHADIHSLDWSPLNGKLYTGCDGGIYLTANGGTTWSDISSGLAIAQVYKIGQSATDPDLTINGYQDNGTAENSGSAFTTVIGGDGMECIVDYSDANYRYGALYYGNIRRSTGGSYSTIAGYLSNGITESGGWVTPYILHETLPATMFAGYKNVWRSTNVKVASTLSVTWTKISTGETTNCNVLEQSPANVDILYVSRGSVLKRSDNANAASPTWTTITSPGGTSPSDIEAHPTDQNIVYATAGTKVYKSTDKGVVWTNISGTLPDIYLNCIVYDKTGNESLYIGNETGAFYKNAGMGDWVLFNSGLPTVDVRELEIYYDLVTPSNSRLKAATYGRGLWQSDLYSGSPLLSVTPANQNAGPMAGSATFTVTTELTWTAVSSDPTWCEVTSAGSGNGTIVATFSQNLLITQRTATITIAAPGATSVVVVVIQAGTHVDVLNPPTNLAAVVAKQNVHLTWNAPARGLIGYNVYRDGNLLNTPAITDLFYDDLSLAPATYVYTVTAVYNEGESVPTSPIVVAVSSGIYSTDFEDFTAGLMVACQDPVNWTTWSNAPCGAEDASISADFAHSGVNSVKDNGSNDLIFKMGDKTAGRYQFEFWMYIPTGKGGYYNLLQQFGATNKWGLEFIFTDAGAANLSAGGQTIPVAYTRDQWFKVTNIVDLDNDVAEVLLGGVSVHSWQWSLGASGTGGPVQLAAANFFSGTGAPGMVNPLYYFDDVEYKIISATPATTTVTGTVSTTVCYNATQTINVAGNGTTFIVQSGGIVTMIAGQVIHYFPGTKVEPGGYMWGYITPGGPWCVTPSIPAVIAGEEELPVISEEPSFKVYPNPTGGKFVLELTGVEGTETTRIEIYGMQGDKILSKELTKERKHEFSLSDKPVGIYFIRVISGNKAETAKIIKKQVR